MTKEDFQEKLFDELSLSELNNLNSKIYYNEKHIEYYIGYNSGEYDWCWDYLIKNRHLLSDDWKIANVK